MQIDALYTLQILKYDIYTYRIATGIQKLKYNIHCYQIATAITPKLDLV